MHTPPVMYYHFNVKLFCINDDIMFFLEMNYLQRTLLRGKIPVEKYIEKE